ncbi:MAG: hypothetical protein OIF47_02630 [Marinibacterium sp.]|nr:hypothetical protein [Marinibacterium sp.]
MTAAERDALCPGVVAQSGGLPPALGTTGVNIGTVAAGGVALAVIVGALTGSDGSSTTTTTE